MSFGICADKVRGFMIPVAVALCIALVALAGCSGFSSARSMKDALGGASSSSEAAASSASSGSSSGMGASGAANGSEASSSSSGATASASASTERAGFSLVFIPAYEGKPSAEVHGGVPFFTENDKERGEFQDYAPLDSLGRCGTAFALVGPETLPTEPRGSIGMVKPSGWQTVRYDWIDGKYLYNRCHLIGYLLTGQNDNACNLVTGTRSLNTLGMLPYEERVVDYVERTGNHVLYRSTPYFEGDDLVARGVLMEALSMEDDGAGIQFCAWCYNVEPGVVIDYATGESHAADPASESATADEGNAAATAAAAAGGAAVAAGTAAAAADGAPPAADASESHPDDAAATEDAAAAENVAAPTEEPETPTEEAQPPAEEPQAPAEEAQPPAEEAQPPVEEAQPAAPEAADVHPYVLNTNTHKFHYPDCSSVRDMAEKNKQFVESTRDEIIANGFQPCGRCKP